MAEYGLLGRKLSHSYSPEIHNRLWGGDYVLIEKEPIELADFFSKRNFSGINVTIPYKKTVIEYLDELSDTAKEIGAVNTVLRRDDGSLFGDNTDAYGFEYMIKCAAFDVVGKKCIILGSGGASDTLEFVLSRLGAGKISKISRSGEDNYGNISKHFDAEIIVNATPVGMFPNNMETLITLENFTHCSAVLDIVYNPSLTKLLLDAKRLGIPYVNGLSMLVAQALYSASLWGLCAKDEKLIESVVSSLEKKMKNIALIGMPGCGKSSVGRKLAKYLGRQFVDCDKEIEKITGKSIPAIFADGGEAEFRRIENKVLSEMSKSSGAVIATGGGVVVRDENYELLKQNSTVVFIDRRIADLSTVGRPLSQSRPIEDIAAERLPKYRLWSDFEIESCGVTATAKKIIKELGYENIDR